MDLETVKTAYRRYAPRYDLYFGAVFQAGRKTVLQTMDCQPGDRILEVGVGTGLSLPLYPRDMLITGIDISVEMLDIGRQRKQTQNLDHVVDLRVMDAEDMEFEDNSFDKVVAMYVATVVPNPAILVEEMRRVCKPDGELIFVNHFHSRVPLISGIERLLTPLSKLMGFRPDLSLEDFIEETGLDVIECSRANLFGYWTLLRASNNKIQQAAPVQVFG